MTGGKIAAPQYLRGLAALMVMLAHWREIGSYPKEHGERLFLTIAMPASQPNFVNDILSWWNWLVHYLWPLTFSFASGGVLIFFLISGFVIAISVEKYETADYAVRRLFRLLPPVWAALALWCAVHALALTAGIGAPQPYKFETFLVNAFLVQDWFWKPSIEPGLWTLLVEVKFYALLAMLSIAVGRLNVVNIIMLSIILSIFTLPFFGDYDALSQVSNESGLWWPFYFFRVMNDCIPFIIFMLIGTLIYLSYADRCSISQLAVAVGTLFALFATTFLIKPNGVQQLYYVTDGLKVLIVFLAAMLWQKSKAKFCWLQPATWLLDKLGNISYPLYLVHGMTGMTIGNVIWLKTENANLATFLGGAITIILAGIIHYVIEKPGQKAGSFLGKKYFRHSANRMMSAEDTNSASCKSTIS